MKRFSELKTGSNVKFGEEIHVSTTQVGRYLKNHSIVDEDGHVYIRTSTSDMTRQALRNIMDGGKHSLCIGDLVEIEPTADSDGCGRVKGVFLTVLVLAITDNGGVFKEKLYDEFFLNFNDFKLIRRIF